MCSETNSLGVKIKIITIFIILGIIFQFFYFDLKKNSNKNFLIKNIEWSSMQPMLVNWEKLKLFVWFYRKNNLKIWDLVAYDRTWKWKKLYIKILKVKWWDKLHFIKNNLFINWVKMKNSVWIKYIFSKNEQKLINLFIINWKLKENSYLIFWDNISNSIDSRKFWAIWKKDIIWKFETIQ